MTLYFFDVHEGDRTSVDESEGAEFAELGGAIEEAKGSIREIVADHAGEGWFVDMSTCFIVVRDGDTSVARVPYADAFEKAS
jgi:hypothetical protein